MLVFDRLKLPHSKELSEAKLKVMPIGMQSMHPVCAESLTRTFMHTMGVFVYPT